MWERVYEESFQESQVEERGSGGKKEGSQARVRLPAKSATSAGCWAVGTHGQGGWRAHGGCAEASPTGSISQLRAERGPLT